MTKAYVAVVYAALWAVALTAPAADPGSMLFDLFTFRGPDPWTIAAFNLMGVWPVLFAAPLLADGPGQRVPAWPFVLLSMAAGAFVLTLYLLVRRWGAPARSPASRLGRWSVLPVVTAIAGLTAAALIVYAATAGAASVFFTRVLEDGFVRTFFADFVAFGLLYPAVALDDRRRFGITGGAWTVAMPLLGAVLHNWRRHRASAR